MAAARDVPGSAAEAEAAAAAAAATAAALQEAADRVSPACEELLVPHAEARLARALALAHTRPGGTVLAAMEELTHAGPPHPDGTDDTGVGATRPLPSLLRAEALLRTLARYTQVGTKRKGDAGAHVADPSALRCAQALAGQTGTIAEWQDTAAYLAQLANRAPALADAHTTREKRLGRSDEAAAVAEALRESPVAASREVRVAATSTLLKAAVCALCDRHGGGGGGGGALPAEDRFTASLVTLLLCVCRYLPPASLCVGRGDGCGSGVDARLHAHASRLCGQLAAALSPAGGGAEGRARIGSLGAVGGVVATLCAAGWVELAAVVHTEVLAIAAAEGVEAVAGALKGASLHSAALAAVGCGGSADAAADAAIALAVRRCAGVRRAGLYLGSDLRDLVKILPRATTLTLEQKRRLFAAVDGLFKEEGGDDVYVPVAKLPLAQSGQQGSTSALFLGMSVLFATQEKSVTVRGGSELPLFCNVLVPWFLAEPCRSLRGMSVALRALAKLRWQFKDQDTIARLLAAPADTTRAWWHCDARFTSPPVRIPPRYTDVGDTLLALKHLGLLTPQHLGDAVAQSQIVSILLDCTTYLRGVTLPARGSASGRTTTAYVTSLYKVSSSFLKAMVGDAKGCLRFCGHPALSEYYAQVVAFVSDDTVLRWVAGEAPSAKTVVQDTRYLSSVCESLSQAITNGVGCATQAVSQEGYKRLLLFLINVKATMLLPANMLVKLISKAAALPSMSAVLTKRAVVERLPELSGQDSFALLEHCVRTRHIPGSGAFASIVSKAATAPLGVVVRRPPHELKSLVRGLSELRVTDRTLFAMLAKILK